MHARLFVNVSPKLSDPRYRCMCQTYGGLNINYLSALTCVFSILNEASYKFEVKKE